MFHLALHLRGNSAVTGHEATVCTEGTEGACGLLARIDTTSEVAYGSQRSETRRHIDAHKTSTTLKPTKQSSAAAVKQNA